MKKIALLLVGILTFITILDVSAKNTVISMNKYKEEKFLFEKDAYDDHGIKDGLITGGYYLKDNKEDDSVKDYQIIVVKYNYKGKKIWEFTHGMEKEDYLDYLTYTYDQDGVIDGYLISSTNQTTSETIFLKIDLNGKLLSSKDLSLNKQIRINKIIPTYTEQKVDGYITIGNNNSNSYLIKLDKELNVVFEKEISNSELEDISLIKNNKKIIAYAVISKNNNNYELLRYNLDGTLVKKISEDLSLYKNYSLAEADNGFILYGATEEVKLKKGEASYYLINYNSKDEDVWESIGDTPVDSSKTIKLLPIIKDDAIVEYLLMYSNNISLSTEVVRISSLGEIKDKIKKINDEYYDIKDFVSYKNDLFLVGQINCLEEDSCEYNSNSLFLISDEDKVIEVKDNDSKNIIIVTIVSILLIITLLIYRKRRKLKN